MASRLARTAVGAARIRPTVTSHTLPVITQLTAYRSNSNLPAQDPKSKAQSIVDALPGNSLISKTAILSAGAGLSIAAISNELFVVNEEAVTAFCLLTVFYAIGKYGGPMYSEFAKTQVDKVRGILTAARDEHVGLVQTRIESVKELDGVVDTTKLLFEVSKETAKLEAHAFELEQKVKVAAEAKKVLDSWVRYENQLKQQQQKELSESIIAKIKKELENPKTLSQILQQSVSDVEKIMAKK